MGAMLFAYPEQRHRAHGALLQGVDGTVRQRGFALVASVAGSTGATPLTLSSQIKHPAVKPARSGQVGTPPSTLRALSGPPPSSGGLSPALGPPRGQALPVPGQPV